LSLTSLMIQHLRRSGRPALFRIKGSAVLLACVGVAMTLGVVASSAGGTVPSFAGPKSYATGRFPVALTVADVNGDGRLDLATANYGEGANSVSVLVNKGGGSFRAGRDYVVGEAPGSLAIGDLNGDRKPDLAVANEVADSVSVLRNNGRGTFERRQDYPTGRAPVSVAIGDVNGDGSRDLAAAVVSGNGVSVLLNKGNGTFLPRRDYRTGREPWSVAIADLTGDGKHDLATANSVANSVSVLANTTGLCTVPNVTGMTVPAAKQALVRGNCRIGAIRRAYSKRVARGRVISETPKVGTVLPKSGKVGIVVSRGARQ
jgi:hypothetical protein